MILTPLNIQIAIIKAFYALAIKSIKYYTGLAFGKNNTCLFKEIRLLRAYVEILKNFEIVGSTITCHCCVEGSYNVLLNSALPVTNVPIEFNCDNQGYIIYNNVGYNFTYWYDESNSKIVIDFTGTLNDVVINVDEVAFTANCDITGDAVSPIEVATIDEITGPPVTVDNQYGTWDGNINVYEPNGNFEINPPVGIIIPAVDVNNVEAVLNLWNTAYPTWVLQYFEGQYVLYTPFDNVNYTNYIVKFKQYEGGDDSSVSFYLASDSPIGLIPFVTENTPAHADILFEQNIFGASQVSQTMITLPPAPLPYVDTPTLAKVDILIPLNQFAVGQAATMTIPLLELFNSTSQDFYYDGNLMFSHLSAYTDMTELVDDFNTNNGLGFTASDGGTLPIPGEVLATASNASTIFNTAVLGDVYTAKLINVPLGNINITIGTYTVGDDSPVEIANFIASSIIAQGDFEGTVSVSGTVITLTAPLGTGNSWNFNAGVSTYAFSIEKPGSRPLVYYFNGGVSPPTTPTYLLDIVAPNIFPQTDYNGGIIEILYPEYEPDGAQFAGAIDDTAGVVTYDDDLNGNIYTSTQNFTDVQSMLNNASMLSIPTATGSITSTIGNNYAVTIELAYPPAFVYNGTTFRYKFDPDGPGRVYNNDGIYYGGNDTTESTYTLVILDGNDNPFGSPITNTGNFQNYQAIVDDLNSQSAFNTYFIASLTGIDIIITSVYSIQGATYNGYTFQLALGYDSIQYSPTYNFVTNVGEMSGGIDAMSPEVNFVNDFNSDVVYNLPQNSYDVDGINGFINLFNDTSPDNYSALLLGTIQDLPEIRSESILSVPITGAVQNTIMRVFYTSGPSINDPRTYIGLFVPIGLSNFAPNVIAAGLVASITAGGAWTGGLATSNGSSIVLKAPLGTFGLFNGRKAVLEKTVPNLRAIASVKILAGSTGAATLQLTVSVGSVNLGIQTIPVAQTRIQWAAAYRDRINSGTGTHGYTAISSGDTVNIYAPLYTGTILNGATIIVTQATGGIVIQSTPTPTFSGGTDTITNVDIKTFNLGGYTDYDQVRFTADPDVYTWEYNGSDFIYTNLSASPTYIYPGEFSGGNDNTAGQLYLELIDVDQPLNSQVLYQDPTPFNYASFQQFTTPINASSTNLDFSAASTNTNLIINSPLNSFAYFNINYGLLLTYTYASPQWVSDNYSYSIDINNGVDPVLTPYEGIFASGVLGDFINTDPCTPTVVTQTCLTNAQVSKIITHINKLIK